MFHQPPNTKQQPGCTKTTCLTASDFPVLGPLRPIWDPQGSIVRLSVSPPGLTSPVPPTFAYLLARSGDERGKVMPSGSTEHLGR